VIQMMRWNDGHDGAAGLGMLVVGGLLLLALIAGVAVLIWLLARGSRPAVAGVTTPVGAPVPPGPGRPTPEEILDERLARGEIDLDTYRATREELGRRHPAPPTG
jgi:putative membrane protein